MSDVVGERSGLMIMSVLELVGGGVSVDGGTGNIGVGGSCRGVNVGGTVIVVS